VDAVFSAHGAVVDVRDLQGKAIGMSGHEERFLFSGIRAPSPRSVAAAIGANGRKA
jgi:hypothetical protein